MKNLHIFQTVKLDIKAQVVGLCTDADNRRLLALTKDLRIYEVQEDRISKPKLVEHDFETASIPNGIDPDDVVLFDFIVESGSLLVVLKNGQFLSFGVSSFSPSSSVVYEHNKEVSSIRLSPDQDLIALADTDNEVFILSSDCTILHTSNALLHNDSVHKPVGVGWGSKETQFFGLDGRPSKEGKSEKIAISENELNNISTIESSELFLRFRRGLNRSTVIDWRGDGQYLATLTHIPENDKHYMKVWNRNLELQYMSDQLMTMERGLLSWIPNGQYVCCAQRREGRINEIAMFEKNGMIHQRITLPTFLPHLYIKELSWSPDSNILALVIVEFEIGSNSEVLSKDMIMLYTMQNFHYYLKYSSYLDCYSTKHLLRWNPIQHNILYVSSTKGKCIEYYCNSTVDYYRNNSAVAVIDANKLLITPFRICNIPPPMSAVTIEFTGLISRLLMNRKSIKKSVVLTLDGNLYHVPKWAENVNAPNVTCKLDNEKVTWYTEKLKRFRPAQLGTDPVDFSKFPNMIAITGHELIATRQDGDYCLVYLLRTNETKFAKFELRVLPKKRVVSIVPRDDHNLILICDDFTCYQTNCEITNFFLPLPERRKPITAVDDRRLWIKETRYDAERDILFILTQDCTLHAEGIVVASNCCTSFDISEKFLIYTSTENLMNFIPLDKLDRKKYPDGVCQWSQPIENGGTLILVSENESKVILQMPRGNLEILRPRILILSSLIRCLIHSNYSDAMDIARKYRVDLNFLCDYMWRCNQEEFYELFLCRFANTIAYDDPGLLNLFITELNNEDTTLGRYSSVMACLPEGLGKFEPNSTVPSSKVNRICSSIELSLDKRYLQPRLLCLLKQEPSKISEALILIHELQDKDKKDEALKFILYFVHVDKLFLDAISTYNTDIALMVASVSAKDPKEYLSLLDNFNTYQEINTRKYVMDMHVKNYEKAFDNLLAALLVNMNKDDLIKQLLELVVDKRIYRHAIKSCLSHFNDQCESTVEPTLDQLRVEVWTKYAEYLFGKRYYLEAGIAYLKTSSSRNQNVDKTLDNVIKCFSLLGQWVRCIAVANRLQPDIHKRRSLEERIRSQAIALGDSLDTLLVSTSVKDNFVAEQLTKTREWHLAEVIVPEASRDQFLKNVQGMVEAEVNEMIVDLKMEIETKRSEFERLKELMLKPQVIENYDTGDGHNADTLSTVDGSEATSVTMSGSGQLKGKAARSGAPSLKTRASSKSAKSQKSKGKKIQLKVGSRYEDMALVLELSKFVDKQKQKQEYARRLLAVDSEFAPLLKGPSELIDSTNELLKLRFNLAYEIRDTLWPKSDLEESNSVYSVYIRYGKLFATGESVDNNEVRLLLRPELPPTLITFDL